MERVNLLREQVAILRALANSFDDQFIRKQLLAIAAQCDEFAKSIEEKPRGAPVRRKGLPPDPR